MKVLVTGAGLIGALTAQALAARGAPVVLMDVRAATGPAAPLLQTVVGDVTDRDRFEAIVAEHGVTHLVHTAAMLSAGLRDHPLRGFEVNVMGAANALEIARRRGLRRVVVASSASIGYVSFRWHGPEPIEEDLPLRMIGDRQPSLYALSKATAEHLALLYGDLFGLDVVALRYGAVLGGDPAAPTSAPGRLLARLVEAARSGAPARLDDPLLQWGAGEDFVDARDCARANVAALDAPSPRQRVYNISMGRPATMQDFVTAARRAMPTLDATAPPPPDAGFAGFPYKRPAASDVSAAARELNFRCAYGLDEAVRRWTVGDD